MCRVTRRDLLVGGAALLGVATSRNEVAAVSSPDQDVGKVDQVASNIYFHVGDISKGYCNNGWIILEDYVLVIDANFPSGATEIMPKIRGLTDKPVRFAFDTHHHGDHLYGNQVWVDNGATPLAHTGVVDEMKRYETALYGGGPGRWEETAKGRADVKASRLKAPSLLFPREVVFDDGRQRVELLHLGIAHTQGDAVAWLPKERILFSGDMCVNGPHNFVGDGNVEKWITTLDAARKLGARVVCPGHGSRGTESMLTAQQRFFQAIREKVGKQISAKKAAQEVKDAVGVIRQEIAAEVQISNYVGDGFASQVEKVYTEMTGERFPANKQNAAVARMKHARDHGLPLLA
jgi:cyclase